MSNFKFFVTGHKGFETGLLHELREILAPTLAELRKLYGGVEVRAGLEAAYRVCLHSRLANRVFCELDSGDAADADELYERIYRIDWSEHLDVRSSFAVAATLSRSKVNHRQFAAQRVKDAIVDQFRATGAGRPPVSRRQPDLQVHVNIHRDRATISLDLAGESLHRRGYRLQHGGAPLKEHLAAALLRAAGWDREAARRLRLLDPLCGSGTFAIEAAQIAANRAPGLTRDYFGFLGWRQHRPDLWRACVDAARAAIEPRPDSRIIAADHDAAVLEIARANARRAGVEAGIEFRHEQVADLQLADAGRATLVITNPPWGKRLEADGDLATLYADLGAAIRRIAPARLAIISANPELLHRLQLTRTSRKPVRSGPLECLFAEFDAGEGATAPATSTPQPAPRDPATVEPLSNRLAKNARHLGRWAKRQDISCYRLYDADLPEFAFALDRYQSALDPAVVWYHLQEYQAPPTIDAQVAEMRLERAAEAVRELFEVPAERLFVKLRKRQRGRDQYARLEQQREFFEVREGPASLLINLSDYLDSGLFLDHRATRRRVFDAAGGKRVLNLFAYTGSVGVFAGLGGAREVVNVDLSPNYLRWAGENHALNGLDDPARYRFLRADALELLRDPQAFSLAPGFDLIFFDPPTFSNSSKMRQTLDIQRDHAGLIDAAMRLLADDGLLLFSTNRRGFRLDAALERRHAVSDITRATIDEDFRRRPRIHRCWEIRHSGAAR